MPEPSQRQLERARKYREGAAQRRSERRSSDLRADARRLQAEYRATGNADDALLEQRQNAVARVLNEEYGFRMSFINRTGINITALDNDATKGLIRRWESLLRKGLTVRQAENTLLNRLFKLQDSMGVNRNERRLLDLLREAYGTDSRGRKHTVSHLARKRTPRGRAATA